MSLMTRRQMAVELLASVTMLLTLVPRPLSAQACAGDCNGDAEVTVDEIVTAVGIALGEVSVDSCAAADGDSSLSVTVDEILAALNAALAGCAQATPTAPATPAPTPTATAAAGPIPTSSAELLAWLQAGSYLGWHAESAIHPSGGPHFGTVRTYVNDVLFESLAAGNTSHPAGAAAVKELYAGQPAAQGWAVEVKVEADSAGGANWYWYERFGSSVFANGMGVSVCTGCHGQDYFEFESKDFVLSHYPLQ